MSLWRKSSAAITAALVCGVASPVLPVAAADVLESRTTSVDHACQLVHDWAATGKGFRTSVTPDNVTVKFPSTVAPGEVFTAYLQPGQMATTGDRKAGQLSYDLAFPPGVVPLGSSINGNASNFSSSSTPFQADQISADGTLQSDGPFVRIWGGNTVSTGSGGTTAQQWKAGLRVDQDRSFRFPEVALRMRAPVNSAGQIFAVGLKGAGGSGSTSNVASNTIQGSEEAGIKAFGEYAYTSKFFCGSSANASSLSSTAVSSSAPRYIAKTSTQLTSEGTHLARSGRTTTLSARVTTNEELMSNVRAGGAMMRFDIRSKATGAVIASPEAGIGGDGVATLSHTFPDLTAGQIRDEYEVTATYTGRANDIESSTSGAADYTVGYHEINANVQLRSTNGALAGGQMPVTLTADLSLPSGRTFPAGMTIQLYRNGQPHGAPVSISSGGSSKQITFPTDVLQQAEDTRTYSYRTVVSPVIINDLDRYAGESPVSVAAIVTGSDPGSPMPEGGHGSLDFTTFFLSPELAWDAIGGSAAGSGTLSVNMTR